ncbi:MULTISPECIES: AMP-binding protein [Tsukamurella]|uniref:AMP-binding protein n=2 Tax=Tsukamurella TaxID=2060 RepID=A0A5C5S198_9ACTN|nr:MULTISPECIES: AMP-binding protein [Tsukamurella]NMD54521.1 AMP-binding protein [Tsukamurella columbiensis]TWS28443.1 AMP-binding protein [Tsukamurella conjunctivitidis]
MYPGAFAELTPGKPAAIDAATGDILSHARLNDESTRLAHHLWALGLRRGDTVAIVAGNDLRIFSAYAAAIRSGLYVTVVNFHLTPGEVNYILEDCEARALFAGADVADAVSAALQVPALADPGHAIAWGGSIPGFADFETVLAQADAAPLSEQPRGTDMLYSSGTTGRPKGIRIPLPEGAVDEVPDAYTAIFAPMYGMDADTVYLSPAPLYHAAPLRFCGVTMSVGGTVIMMHRFDPEEALALIAKYRVTHSQWVPTMFVRMLKLPAQTRSRYDTSSLKVAIHAAAPCPAEVKQSMLAWWGPVIHEYYASTEAAGATFIGPQEALERPGSVGRAGLGIARICGDDGAVLPVGEVGTIYFERDAMPFAYHNAPEKTRSAQHPDHENWATTGDVGYLDEDGYLYLTDRKDFMIISGGVNIYPQESENALIMHPAVTDVAVIGVPHDDLGETALACVQLAPGTTPSDELAQELIAYAGKALARYKLPRAVRFVDSLPRTPTGKLVKRLIPVD